MWANTCREQNDGEREWERVNDKDFISFKNETLFIILISFYDIYWLYILFLYVV